MKLLQWPFLQKLAALTNRTALASPTEWQDPGNTVVIEGLQKHPVVWACSNVVSKVLIPLLALCGFFPLTMLYSLLWCLQSPHWVGPCFSAHGSTSPPHYPLTPHDDFLPYRLSTSLLLVPPLRCSLCCPLVRFPLSFSGSSQLLRRFCDLGAVGPLNGTGRHVQVGHGRDVEPSAVGIPRWQYRATELCRPLQRKNRWAATGFLQDHGSLNELSFWDTMLSLHFYMAFPANWVRHACQKYPPRSDALYWGNWECRTRMLRPPTLPVAPTVHYQLINNCP